MNIVPFIKRRSLHSASWTILKNSNVIGTSVFPHPLKQSRSDMVFIKIGPYHVKINCIQYLKEQEEGITVHFGKGSHPQMVTLDKEEGMELLGILNQLEGIA